MTENSVKNIASMFNQPNQSAGMARPAVAAKPTVGSKPSVLAKPPGKLDLNSSIKIIGPNVRSPRFEKPSNGAVKSPSKDSLKRDSPKPAAAPAKAPVGGPVMPGTNMAEILNMRNMLKKAPVPAPSPTTSQSEPRVDFKRSLKKSPVAPPTRTTPSLHQKTAPPSQGTDEMDTSSKENISTSKSEGDCSSLSSFTSDSSIPRRGSATSQKTTGDNQKPILEILPPLETIGPAPRKPAKPVNVKLPKSAAMPPSANPEPIDSGADSGEIYDDVAVETNKRFSLIPTMDSDEETGDDIYDDTEVVPSAPLPPLPACLSIPTIAQTSGPDDGPQEIYDDVSLEGESEELYEALDVSTEDAQQKRQPEKTWPKVKTKGRSTSVGSTCKKNRPTSKWYVSRDAAATDVKRPSIESSDSADVASRPTTTPSSLLSPRKTMSTKKQEEKQRKEQERLEKERRKKEEEMRKKREKEEKKRKEKEEKEMKKKFNIKGEIQVLDSGTVTQDCGSDYERTDLICKRGDRLEVLRRDGNPPGKWLARDLQGRYGFVDADFVAIETDFQEPYDDVIPCDGSGSEEEEEQEIYEAFD
ncbi:FYN-binding protein 1-like isoform X2 [Patiria miniata]|uniref:Helically-extended SH3 domain-containing protein n=1 Tax=Patiria miniata TaxID=46514 RepID=A0A914AWX4_PATMI|nr:FYN-binding protein 1-like isoform X2 [Patiria miniata]XP_038068217.1 FYN-binding protein 1-like isoform X2 [Patiria miniata]